jgi:hypothetical protein
MHCAWLRLADDRGGLGLDGIQDAEGASLRGEHLRSINVHFRTGAAHTGSPGCDSHGSAGGNARGSGSDAARGMTVDNSTGTLIDPINRCLTGAARVQEPEAHPGSALRPLGSLPGGGGSRVTATSNKTSYRLLLTDFSFSARTKASADRTDGRVMRAIPAHTPANHFFFADANSERNVREEVITLSTHLPCQPAICCV